MQDYVSANLNHPPLQNHYRRTSIMRSYKHLINILYIHFIQKIAKLFEVWVLEPHDAKIYLRISGSHCKSFINVNKHFLSHWFWLLTIETFLNMIFIAVCYEGVGKRPFILFYVQVCLLQRTIFETYRKNCSLVKLIESKKRPPCGAE